jgi:uracil-DNA glycosylase
MEVTDVLNLGPSWNAALKNELKQDYLKETIRFVKERSSEVNVYPPLSELFTAYHLTPFDKVRVVIIGQDPYHGPGQAHGLSFSVPRGIKIPPSLRNIFKELENDLSIPASKHGSLIHWAEQGVLLLNASLSVEEGSPLTHEACGWTRFTDATVAALGKREDPVIFLLWGRFAQEKSSLITSPTHSLLKAAHPSPFSAYRGFFGCSHFSKTNDILVSNSQEPIEWNLCQ